MNGAGVETVAGPRALTVRARALALGVGALALLVLAVGLAVQVATLALDGVPDGLTARFGLNFEGGVPAAFSALVLLATAALAALEAVLAHRARDRDARWWAATAALFALLGAEEFLAVHELTIEPLRTLLGADGLLYYAWIVPGALLAVAAAVAFSGFVRRLPAAVRRPLLGGFALMAGGAFGMEAVGGWWVSREGSEPGRMLLYTLEEALELAGAVVVLAGFLRRWDGARLTVPAR